MSSPLYNALVLAGIPLVLTGFFAVALLLPVRTKDPDAKVSGWAGVCAGIVLVLLYLIGVSDNFQPQSTPAQQEQVSFPSGIALLLGIIVGFALPHLMLKTLTSRFLGVLTLLISSSSLVAMLSCWIYSYYREVILYLTLGTLFGAFLNGIFSPQVLKTLANPSQRAASNR